jgi:lipoprotein-anchoring transpeptidase ErfK/SrfK
VGLVAGAAVALAAALVVPRLRDGTAPPTRRATAAGALGPVAPAAVDAPPPARAAAPGSSDAAGTAGAPAVPAAPLRDPRLVRAAALSDTGLRVLVSLGQRRLYVLAGPDTLRVAPVGIGMDSTLVYRGRVWNFRTPRGIRRVRDKEAEPVWVPPEWHYVEVARARGLKLVTLRADRPIVLADSSRIEVQDDEVGLVRPSEPFTPFAHDEEVIWEGTLYIPPIGTKQRRVTGELGPYRLDLGDGYLLHGTPHAESIGEPSSHGCMRLADEDITWLFENVPVGTPVYTY